MKLAYAFVLAVLIIGSASGYPLISNSTDVQLNQWTYQYNSGMALASVSGRPVMLAFVNQGGCSWCARWDSAVISNINGTWLGFIEANPMVLIWVDQGRDDLYVNPTWSKLISGNKIWPGISAYPEIVILSSDGKYLDEFVARGNVLGTSNGFVNRVITAINGVPPVVPPSVGRFPASGVGQYGGVVYRNDGKVSGVLSVSASISGSISAKLELYNTKISMRQSKVNGSNDTFSVAMTSRDGKQLELEADGLGNLIGTFDGNRVEARKRTYNSAGMSDFNGYYTTVFSNTNSSYSAPGGKSFMGLTINSARGTAKYAGAMADGTRVSGSAVVLIYNSGNDLYACVPLYKKLYRGLGAVSGLFVIDGVSPATMLDNTVSISGSQWFKLGAYGFNTEFDAGTPVYIGASFNKYQDLYAVFQYSGLFITGIEDSIDLVKSGFVFRVGANTVKARLSVSRLSGKFTGAFNLQLAPGVSTPAKLAGMLISSYGNAYGGGYYLLDQRKASLYGVNASQVVEIK